MHEDEIRKMLSSDRRDVVIDLAGAEVAVTRPLVIPGRMHNVEICNGTIRWCGDRATGVFEIACGVEWGGVSHSHRLSMVAFNLLEIQDCTARLWTDSWRYNLANYKMAPSAINVVRAGRLRHLVVNECRFDNFGSGISCGASQTVTIDNCDFEHIAGNCIGVLTLPNNDIMQQANISQVVSRSCGTLFDFSIQDKTASPPVRPQATVAHCTAIDMTGRTKVHGPWNARISDSVFLQTRLIPHEYGAINFPGGDCIEVRRCAFANYFFAGVSTTNDTTAAVKPQVSVSESIVSGSLNAVVNQVECFVLDRVVMENCFRVSHPRQMPQMHNTAFTGMSESHKQSRIADAERIAQQWEREFGARPRWPLP